LKQYIHKECGEQMVIQNYKGNEFDVWCPKCLKTAHLVEIICSCSNTSKQGDHQ
jgi:hypothetical protein